VLTVLSAVSWAEEAKEPAARESYVRKGTWQESMLASRARLARLMQDRQGEVELGPWHTTGPLTAESFDAAFFPEEGVDLLAVDENEEFLWTEGKDRPADDPDAALRDLLGEDEEDDLLAEADDKEDEAHWPDGKVHRLAGDEWVSTYLFRIVETEKPLRLTAGFGSSDGLAVWLNGTNLLSRDVVRTAAPNQDWVDLDLKPGENRLLLKIFNGSGQHEFFFSTEHGPAFRVWRQVARDFPLQANWMKRDLEGRHLSWFCDVGDVELTRSMIGRALERTDAGEVYLRREFAALARANTRPDDRRWLDLYVRACWSHEAPAMLAQLSRVLDEVGPLCAKGLSEEIRSLRKTETAHADPRWLGMCVKAHALLGRLRAVRTRMEQAHPQLASLSPRALRQSIRTFAMNYPPRYTGVENIVGQLGEHEKRLQQIELAVLQGDDGPMTQIPVIIEKLRPLAVPNATATGWPVYRGDNFRSGYSIESLPADLSRHWTYQARHAPRPAWSGRDTRMPFDRAYHTVIADGTLFFGSSADFKVYALDAATGAERWTFFTGGPVRFAPAVWKGRVFVVSDDGFFYCLATKDGSVRWKRRGGPNADLVLGNERMISRWPARGAPVIMDDKIYFAAGIWPSEGIYLYALDAATGRVLWVNDSSGGLVMEQPHGGNRARSGISAQGYLAADKDRVYVPTGRGVPAVFDRATGELLYFFLAANIKNGGSDLVLGDRVFFNGGRAFDSRTGSSARAVRGQPAGRTVVSPEGIASSGDGQIDAFQLTAAEQTDGKGGAVQLKSLATRTVPSAFGGTALIMAGQTLISAGKEATKETKSPDAKGAASGDKSPRPYGVSATDFSSGNPAWAGTVDGIPLGLAVADGRLYVSTNKGNIICYGATGAGSPKGIKSPTEDSPYTDNDRYAEAAEEIIRQTGIVEGYCLDLGCGDGALALALATRTKLHIVAIDRDPENVALARRKLDRAGLHGVRVSVHQGDPGKTPFSDYFANLVVSGRSVTDGPGVVPSGEMNRLMRPYGGVACFGKSGAMRKEVRGALGGAGEWTHQYANAASTLCSDDRLARGPLEMHWFHDFGFQVPNRHGRGPAPLFKRGILVIEGVHGLLAVDAYNGHRLWELPLEGILRAYDQEHLVGTAGTNSNICVAGDSVYLRTHDRCLRLSLTSGETQQEYQIPAEAGVAEGKPAVWGYIACVDGTLFGSTANRDYIVRPLHGGSDMRTLLSESSVLFALDVETGEQKWVYRARHSLRHNAIVIGGERVYLIDRPLVDQNRIDFKKRRGIKEESPAAAGPPPFLLCLDAATGRTRWQSSEGIYGTTLALSTQHEVLVMGYQYSQRSFQFPSEKGNRLTGLRASDGTRLWDAEGRYISRPLINGRKIFAQPHAYDLLTGKRDEDFVLTGRGPGGCGTISGSKHLLLYRSGPLGYTDLLRRQGSESYGGPRPGCWVNAIPAGGLVLMPDATDRCRCSYLIKSSYALGPRRER